MTGRLLKVAGWLAIGGAIVLAGYWLFLNTPESNALMLTASAALALALIAVSAVTVGAAVMLAQGAGIRDAVRTASRRIHWFIVAATPVLVAWVIMGQVDAWIGRYSGEIHAWFIARFGWSDVSVLFQAETWLSRWIRWVAAPIASLCLLVALSQTGAPALASTGWIRHAWHWRTLTYATAIFVVLFALPWLVTSWRPQLPATWIEPVVAGLRLGFVAILGVVGAALLISVAARKTSR